MSTDKTILSTKKLSVSQKELLLNAGVGFVEYDAIKIELLHPENFDYSEDLKGEIKNAIFTSKNAVKSIQNSKVKIQRCFCVGANTRKLLEENGFTVVEMALNAADLARIIVEKYSKEVFLFFCGNLRRDELPIILKDSKVQLKELVVYHTVPNRKALDRSFDGVLFFSPSAIQSFVLDNKIKSTAFCIGSTTAAEASKHTQNIIVANKPTVENVIVQAVKYLNNK